MRAWFTLLSLVVFYPQLADPVPELRALPVPARVVDETAILSSEYSSRLNDLLAQFESERGAQVVVVVIASTGPESIEEFTLRLAETWQVGRKGRDDGVVLLVAKDDRKMRIEVGYGLEGQLPDALCKQIISDRMVPLFRSGEYESGIEAGIQAILSAIRAEPGPESEYIERAAAEEAALLERYRWRPGLELFSYVWIGVCGILGLILIALDRYPLAFLGVPVLYALPILVFSIWDAYFWAAFVVVPLYWFALFLLIGIIAMIQEGGAGGSSSSSSSGGYRSSSYSSSSSSSSSSGSSSSSRSYSGGGGSFGGGGASGSW